MRSTLIDAFSARLELAEALYLGLDIASRALIDAAFESEIAGLVELASAAGLDEADASAALRVRAMSRATRWLAPSDRLDDLAAVLDDASRDADRLDPDTELLFDELYIDALADPEISILGALAFAALRLDGVEAELAAALTATQNL